MLKKIINAMKAAEDTRSLLELTTTIPSSEWIDPNSTGECVRIHLTGGEMMDIMLDDGWGNAGWWVRRWGAENEYGWRYYVDEPTDRDKLAAELCIWYLRQ